MIDLDLDLTFALEHLKSEAVQLMRDSAATCQETAQKSAPVDSGHLRRSIEVDLTDDGANVESRAPYSIFQEWGTGVFAEGGDGRKEPWVYQRDDGAWITTNGAPASPFMRPGFAAGKAYFNAERKRRGLS